MDSNALVESRLDRFDGQPVGVVPGWKGNRWAVIFRFSESAQKRYRHHAIDDAQIGGAVLIEDEHCRGIVLDHYAFPLESLPP